MFRRSLLKQCQTAHSAFLIRARLAPSSPSRGPSFLQTFPQSLSSLPPRLCRRYASTEPSKEDPDKGASALAQEDGGKETPADAEESLRQELETKKKEIIDLKDKYLRSVADFRNLQERTRRDVEAARTFAIQRFATDLIESIDNLDRALSVVPSEKISPAENDANKDLVDLFSGLKMTENILMSTLKKHGLERFDPSEPTEEGQPQKFNPRLHEATFMTAAEGKEDGDVMHTQSKGYTLNGRVLRAAKVGVVKNP